MVSPAPFCFCKIPPPGLVLASLESSLAGLLVGMLLLDGAPAFAGELELALVRAVFPHLCGVVFAVPAGTRR